MTNLEASFVETLKGFLKDSGTFIIFNLLDAFNSFRLLTSVSLIFNLSFLNCLSKRLN